MIMCISSFHSHLTLLLHVYEKLVDCLVLLEGPLDDHNTVRSETCDKDRQSHESITTTMPSESFCLLKRPAASHVADGRT